MPLINVGGAAPSTNVKCGSCGDDAMPATRVSIHGMYDMHLFHKVEGSTVDEVIDNWVGHISKPIPAQVGDDMVADLGPSWLCPVTVLSGDKELRRVGKGVRAVRGTRKPNLADVDDFRKALLADPDISRLLAQTGSGIPTTSKMTHYIKATLFMIVVLPAVFVFLTLASPFLSLIRWSGGSVVVWKLLDDLEQALIDAIMRFAGWDTAVLDKHN